MPKRIIHHIHEHPWRLAATLVAVLCVSWGLAGYIFYTSLRAAHQSRVNNCNAVNELSRKVYVTAADLGAEPHEIRRLLPTMNCEDIP